MTSGSANVSTGAPAAVTIGTGLRYEPGGVWVAFAVPAPETRQARTAVVDATTAVAARTRRLFTDPPSVDGRLLPGSARSNREKCKIVAVTDHQPFADVLAANDAYARAFALGGLDGRAARGLAVLTCMDSRIEPLRMLGLEPGAAKILRNAGARVTDDVLRTLVLAAHLLGVDRFMVVAHTRCRMAAGNEDDVHAAVEAAGGPDTRSLAFLVAPDQEETVREDVQRILSCPYLGDLRVGGFLYDVDTGRLRQLC